MFVEIPHFGFDNSHPFDREMFQVSYSDDPLPLLTTVDGSKLEQILPNYMENLRISHILLRLCIFQVTLVGQGFPSTVN